MEPVGGPNPVLDALRRQLAENIERLRKAGRLAPGSRADASGAAARAETLDAALRRRLAAIDRRSADGPAQAARIFAESVLAAEFGDAILTDPGLGDMVREVGKALHEDPAIRAELDRLLGEL
jgi:phage-related baseplate assembly protein